MVNRPDFTKETLDGTPMQYAPSAWVCAEIHCPSGVANIK
jgi:hypothetical protein